jgi:hypothetical protein
LLRVVRKVPESPFHRRPDSGWISALALADQMLEGPAGGVRELPNEISLAGIDGKCVSPAHRDHYVGGLGDLVGERLRKLLKQVDADLGHRFSQTGVNFLGWGRVF